MFEKVEVGTPKNLQKCTDYDGTDQNSKLRLQVGQKYIFVKNFRTKTDRGLSGPLWKKSKM